MTAKFLIVLLAMAIAYVTHRLAGGLRLYLKLRGKRLITCPETKKTEAVNMAAGSVAMESLLGQPHLRLKECSRWPEGQNCGQDCLGQIEAALQDCLVSTIISKWYEGRKCVFCGKLCRETKWPDQKPALIGVDRKTVEWDEIPAERLPEVLETHRPVCWNCHITQTFRREHPDLVMDSPKNH